MIGVWQERDVNTRADEAPDKIQRAVFTQTIPFINAYVNAAAETNTKDNHLKNMHTATAYRTQ